MQVLQVTCRCLQVSEFVCRPDREPAGAYRCLNLYAGLIGNLPVPTGPSISMQASQVTWILMQA
jgi:hypothetical protein